MLDFTIFQPIRSDALASANASDERDFARIFAQSVARAAKCTVRGSYEDDGYVHLYVNESDEEAVIATLDERKLHYGV